MRPFMDLVVDIRLPPSVHLQAREKAARAVDSRSCYGRWTHAVARDVNDSPQKRGDAVESRRNTLTESMTGFEPQTKSLAEECGRLTSVKGSNNSRILVRNDVVTLWTWSCIPLYFVFSRRM